MLSDDTENHLALLYNSINIIDKEKTDFNSKVYSEIIYLTMYMYHIKKVLIQ